MTAVARLEKGYRPGFRIVRRPGAALRAPGKWIAWLPVSCAPDVRERLVERFFEAVQADPFLGPRCSQAKLCLKALVQDPNRVAWMVYCETEDADAVGAGLKQLARAHRRHALRAGELQPRDGGFLGWRFKTDHETRQELAQGTHPRQIALWMELLGVEATLPNATSRSNRP